DDARLLAPIDGAPALWFRDSGGMSERDEDVRRFQVRERIRPGAAILRDFDFLRPSLLLEAESARSPTPDAFDARRLSIYEHDGEYFGAEVDAAVASRHLEQHRARALLAEGESRCVRLSAGRWMELTGAALPDHDGRYTVLSVTHEGHTPELAAAKAGPVEVY